MSDFLALSYEGFPNTNIGDYIQSLAAMQFYDTCDFFHRDNLGKYTGNPKKAILNGWFTHCPENWPPSPLIEPLFVAFHINSSSDESILSDESIKYLKRYEPIGCRDEESASKLRTKGIKAYFSSCLTTTLGYHYGKSGKRKGICIVDPVHFVPEANRKFQKYIILFKGLRYAFGIHRYIKSLKLNNNYILKFDKRGLNRLLQIIRSYIIVRQLLTSQQIKNATILTQYHYSEEYPTRESRFKRAEELLNIYASSELVITSRIHCALPCQGLGTPALFLQNMDDSKESTCRFSGLLDLLNVIKFRKDKILETPYEWPINPAKVMNKTNFKEYAIALKRKCLDFVKR